MSFQFPVSDPISQYFGANPSSYQPDGHYGMDFACQNNTPVHSIGAGTVVWADWGYNMGGNPWAMIPFSDASGIIVIIDHGDYFSLYAHLSSTDMNIGDRVSAGQVIAKSGNTGRSTGPHLHLELVKKSNINGYMYGRVNPLTLMSSTVMPVSNPTLGANQRRVGGSNLNQRDSASTSGNVVRTIDANTVETFNGFVYGESVTVSGEAGVRQSLTSNIWYKDDLGYVWAGGFTEQSTSGLPDLTPAAPSMAANQRKVGGSNLNQRSEPNTSATVVRTIDANTVETFNGFVYGESVTVSGEAGVRQSLTSNIWYKDDLGYVWAGGFTEQKTDGLSDLTPAIPNPTPTKPAPAVEPAYGFKPDFDFVEYHPANTWNMQDGNFPEKPTHVVIHQFDAKSKKPTLDGVISWFAKDRRPESQSSAHFSVSGKRIVQHVSLKDRAFHAGPIGNSYVGIETDPMQDNDTIESTKKLLSALKGKYGYELILTRHKDVPQNSTNCGSEINLDDFVLDVVDSKPPVEVTVPENPAPYTPPKPAPENPEAEDEDKAVANFLDWLREDYLNRK